MTGSRWARFRSRARIAAVCLLSGCSDDSAGGGGDVRPNDTGAELGDTAVVDTSGDPTSDAAGDAPESDADAAADGGSDAAGDAGSDPGSDAGDDLVALSDDFEVADGFAGWTVLNGELAEVTESDGRLRLAPVASSVWLGGQTAALVYKELSGDFRVTARLEASDGAGGPPDGAWEYGGLMGRLADPGADGTAGEDYVFITLGHNTGTTGVEGKVTDDGNSVWAQSNIATEAGVPFQRWLRLCRVGNAWHGYHRSDDGSWAELVLSTGAGAFYPVLDRADFGAATLTVGVVAYSNNATDADLVVEVEGVTFERVGSVDGCLAD